MATPIPFLREPKYFSNHSLSNSKYEELYIHEILGGKPSSDFPGIYCLLKDFM